MRNLLEETYDVMSNCGLYKKDIVFIGSLETGHQCSWEEFEILADKEYNAGYGAQDVATDLVIVFKDKEYLSRQEYDGREWWELNTIPQLPLTPKPIKNLFGGYWKTLKDINDNN